jgi:hypothetical protein
MAIIQEIRDTPSLMAVVDKNRFTKRGFDRLLSFIASPEFQKVMGRIRNNLTFHYDPRTIEKALRSLVQKHPDAQGTMTLGDEPHNWYFEPGDMVADRAAVREIFKVPETADVREETDKIVIRLHAIVQTFGGVAASIIWDNSR